MNKAARYILALDQGTTSSRAIIFNRAGTLIASAQEEFPQIYPKSGWVEHNPEAIWESQYNATKKAISRAQIDVDQIEAMGISNQRETVIVWERDTGKPVYNAIVWQCRRSASICRDLIAAGKEPFIREKTGLLLDPYFSATKLAWLFNEKPELRRRAENGELLFGTVDTWLCWRLTGEHKTDVTNASRTLLFNIHTLEWDTELLELFKIPPAILPKVCDSSGIFGYCKPELFGREIPLSAILGDQAASLFGQTCFEAGSVKNTYGTGCFALLNIGEKALISKNRLLTSPAWKIGGKTTYALEGSVFIGGAVIQWLRDELAILSNATESEALARSIPDTGGLILVPAFVGLGAPWWDSEARGLMLGISRGTGRAELVRAALESIALQSEDLLSCMADDFGQEISIVKADGGAAANSFLMQYQADISNCTIVLPEVYELSALGAAYMAGLATGYWESLDEIAKNWKVRRSFKPKMDKEERSAQIARWRKAVALAREGSCL